MDPFNTRPASPSSLRDAGNQPCKSSAGLRRSAGLFNLKLDVDSPKPEVLDENVPLPVLPTGTAQPATLASMASISPTSTSSACVGNSLAKPGFAAAAATPQNAQSGKPGILTPDTSLQSARPRANALSLKRPHPFSSTKSHKQSGFLSRSSASFADSLASPAGQKRLHLTHTERTQRPIRSDSSIDSLSSSANSDITPELSFRGAKPVQTAFVSAGLQSKRNAPQSPKPRVPETPCKRSTDPHDSVDSSRYCTCSPFQGVRKTMPGRLPEDAHELCKSCSSHSSRHTLTDRLETMPSHCSSPRSPRPKASGCPHASPGGSPRCSPTSGHPVDRLQRFSIGHISDLEPKTPTRFESVHTSTPLFRYSRGAGTPGTAARVRLPAVLQSADPADSMSASPPESLDINSSMNSFATVSSSSPSDSSLTHTSPETPDVELFRRPQAAEPIVNSSSVESQSSPRSRRALRLFDLWHGERKTDEQQQQQEQQEQQEQPLQHHYQETCEKRDLRIDPAAPPLPHVPPLRVETPLGRISNEYPQTPSQPSHCSPLLTHDNSTSRCLPPVAPSDPQRPAERDQRVPSDDLLSAKFDRVQRAAFGEFSAVFVVAQGKQRFAVKRTKKPMLGQRERLRRREEVEILRMLASPAEVHVVQLIDEWEANNFGYIMTEFCENGDLSRFLADQGRVSRLEEWRVWKILVEILQGLAVIHSHNILHLDLKPANVFVTFEGHLKIGDFGMATREPVPRGFEREGDREYIAPEVLERQQYGKPADIFSVGIMMVEIAANIVLPDNGVHWHRLRSGDLTDAGRLSSGDLASTGFRGGSEKKMPYWAPKFLVDNEGLLDDVVRHMLNPQPENRPTVAQLLLLPELLLVDQRGQAGAVVFEGEFGPKPETEDEVNVWQRA